MRNEVNFVFPATSKELQKLGIRWRANMYWKEMHPRQGVTRYVLVDKLRPFDKGVPAYSLSEIGLMMPFGFFNTVPVMKFLGGYFKLKIDEKKELTFSTEVEARANYLIHLIKTGQAQVEPVGGEGKK